MRNAALVALIASLALACYERPDTLNSPLAVTRTFALGERALVLQANPERALLLDASGASPARHEWPFACRVGPTQSDGQDLVAVLCWGDDPDLRLLRLVEGQTPAWENVPLDAAYSALTRSPDARFLIASYAGGGSSGSLFQNASEITVLDLEAPLGEGNPARRVLDMRDRDPQGVVIGPRFTHAGGESMLALVLATSQVVAFDLLNPATPEEVIPLVPSGTLAQIRPQLVRFLPREGGGLDVFLTAQGAADVFHLAFAGEGTTPRAAIQLLTLPGMPADVLPFRDAEGDLRVLALSTLTQEAVLFEPERGLQRAHKMPWAFSSVLPIPRADGAAHFLLFRPDGGGSVASSVLVDLDVAEADKKSADTFTPIELGAPVASLQAVEGSATFLVRHPGASLTVLDGATGARTLVKELGQIQDARLAGAHFAILTWIDEGLALGVLDLLEGGATTVDVPAGSGAILGFAPGSGALLDAGVASGAGGLVAVRLAADTPQVTEWRGYLLDGAW